MSNIEIVRITFKAAIVTKLKNHQKRFLVSADTVHLLQKEYTYIIENSHICSENGNQTSELYQSKNICLH